MKIPVCAELPQCTCHSGCSVCGSKEFVRAPWNVTTPHPNSNRTVRKRDPTASRPGSTLQQGCPRGGPPGPGARGGSCGTLNICRTGVGAPAGVGAVENGPGRAGVVEPSACGSSTRGSMCHLVLCDFLNGPGSQGQPGLV
ncbi:hypothetical protein TREES_T100017497 [Tupaia chinensis]|uniref:Uncharacterized protein n=1 Tax=Tupaia chinensis TaxID=246437 RepID=L9LCW7_TUPCH|nr:hypothetical protein TREES_T100017497 [Tupaia chinensis]